MSDKGILKCFGILVIVLNALKVYLKRFNALFMAETVTFPPLWATRRAHVCCVSDDPGARGMDRNIGDQLNKAFEAYRQVSIEKDNAKKELQKMVGATDTLVFASVDSFPEE